ncbi:MAG TPA: hypothetical protein VL463_32770 [Kofleriaceae bacterium]|nr:hypothetical protein [Kofleriaceae bacterium]
MKKLSAIVLGLVMATSVVACNKPKEEDCRRALDNIRRLSGTDKLAGGVDLESWVRRCRGNSKQQTVACAIAAQTLDQLKQCNIPIEADKSPFAPGGGSASGSGSGSSK